MRFKTDIVEHAVQLATEMAERDATKWDLVERLRAVRSDLCSRSDCRLHCKATCRFGS